MQQTSAYRRLGPTVTQLMMAQPTRAALVWSAKSLTPYPETARELAGCAASFAFAGDVKPGSLGAACLEFRERHCLAAMDVTAAASDDPAQILASRRVLLHDLLHVLLGFSADWPGQIGVFSFVAAQRYCPQFAWAARVLGQLYITAAPWKREELREAELRGRQLATLAPPLLLLPLEHEWQTSLYALRVQLNLKRWKTLPPIDATPVSPSSILESHKIAAREHPTPQRVRRPRRASAANT